MEDDGHNIKGLTIELTQALGNLPLPTGRPLFALRARSPMGRRPKRGNSSLRQSLPAGRQGRLGGILEINLVTILRRFHNVGK